MEEDTLASGHANSSQMPFIMVALGLAGLLAGATALFLHFSHHQDPLPQALKLQEHIALLQEQTLQLQNQVHVLENQVTQNTLQLQAQPPAHTARTRGNAQHSSHSQTLAKPHEPEASPALGLCQAYTIQNGDTFAKIAERQHISLQALLGANPGVDPKRLQVGQVIQVPRSPSSAASP
jgi:LysM repeat protein